MQPLRSPNCSPQTQQATAGSKTEGEVQRYDLEVNQEHCPEKKLRISRKYNQSIPRQVHPTYPHHRPICTRYLTCRLRANVADHRPVFGPTGIAVVGHSKGSEE